MNERFPPESHMRWMPFIGAMLTLAFGIWAGVVAWGIRSVISEVVSIHDESSLFHREFNNYVLQSERRLAILEEQQKSNTNGISRLEAQHDAWIQEASRSVRRIR